MNVATHTQKPKGWQPESDMSLSNQTESELFQALQAGNLSALGAIYDRYGEAVYRLALRIRSQSGNYDCLFADND